ncbi:MAG TPA: Smr/MutS family protein [Xanthobacteraceae bacterium]|jgi:DNA-nicking Smr family endonuclease
MSRRRRLSDEEQALWTTFARSITPLPTRASPPNKPSERPVPGAAAAAAPTPLRPHARNEKRVHLEKTPPLMPIDRRLKQRLARGRDPIDARIDLHGLTQGEAHAVLLRFLRCAQADGAKIALVVTGKGSGLADRQPSAERGVLRRRVPLWLSLPEFRAFVVGFADAYAGHGGQGALYVRLRRAREICRKP